MGSASLYFDTWTLAWQEFWERLAPRCSHLDCWRTQTFWRRFRGKPRAILLQGSRYCLEHCLERALADLLWCIRSAPRSVVAAHRVPLGLLLLSRQQLTADQLRTALAAQRTAGHGRIGEWVQTLGFASEQQVTAALAKQWSCPLLRMNSFSPKLQTADGSRVPQIPRTVLEAFLMIPVDYVSATATLHLAFGDGIDYSVLYAVEQMSGCRTVPCMAVPSLVRQSLQSLPGRRDENEVVFDQAVDAAEFARIVRSYCVRLAASQVTLVACGPHLWVRLFRPPRPPLDLMLRSLQEAPTTLLAPNSSHSPLF
jgi:hypothetical protein